ncbi:MAG: InlB B-repeat-containing protein, partial [Planctomycetota bacterium]
GVTADVAVTANFEINTYTLTYSAGAHGSISGASPQTVNHGADGTAVTAVPDTGYHFVNWSDGSTANPRTDTNVTADITVTANFDAIEYEVTGISGGNGSIAPAGATTVTHGSDLGFTAVPDDGYQVDTWSIDGGVAQTGGTSYTLTDIQAAHTVEVTFRLLEYTITSLAGSGGSISPAGDTTVIHGDSLAFTATAGAGHEVRTWSLDGAVVQTGGTSFTLSDIQADHTVEVTFRQLQYTITATPGPGGLVTPVSIDVHYGGNHTFTATPNVGYQVDTWSLDGSVVKTGGLTYELSPIYTDHDIHVTFRNMLSYSLGTYGFEDEEETEAGVINNNSDLDLPDEPLVLVEPVGLGLDPDNMVMGLHNRTDSGGQTVNARAKGMFIGTGADEVLIRFKYLFTTSDTMLVIYLSDSPELLTKDDPLWEQHYRKVAELMPPPYPRPGSPDSGRFGVFQKIVWTGHLDCSEGLYSESFRKSSGRVIWTVPKDCILSWS